MTDDQIAKLETLANIGLADVVIKASDLTALIAEVRLRGADRDAWKSHKLRLETEHADLKTQIGSILTAGSSPTLTGTAATGIARLTFKPTPPVASATVTLFDQTGAIITTAAPMAPDGSGGLKLDVSSPAITGRVYVVVTPATGPAVTLMLGAK